VLDDALARSPRDGTIALYLGMSAEQLGDYAGAREAYSTYLRHGRTSRVRRELQSRLAALARLEMRASVRAALARENELAAATGDPNVVAVMPFRFTGSDSSLRPLERGLADLTVTDLARIASLRVVERAQVQALLDEIDLGASERADTAMAVRSGRMLQAGRIVQGAITQLPGDETIRLDGAVVDVPTAEVRGADGTDDSLDELFAMQKRFTFSVLEALGVQASAEERSAIEQRPTRSLAAFLAYSNGLAEADAGRLDAAERSFGEALRIDPAFGLARERQQETQSAMLGASASTATIEQSLAGTSEGRVAEAAAQGTVRPAGDGATGTLAGIVNDVNPSVATEATRGSTPVSVRDPAAATTGTEQIRTERGTVIIIVRQPPKD
jgi:TolB-like protein